MMEAPEHLVDVPREKRLYQQFGWHPILGFISCATGAVLILVDPKYVPENIYIVVGLAVVGGFLLFWEFFRRARSVVLVGVPNGIGMYRKGKLDLVAEPGSIRRYVLSWWNTFRFLIIPVILTITFLGGYLDRKGVFLFLIGAGICALSTASVVYTRILCRHYFIPRAAGRRMQQVVLSRSNIREHPELHEMLDYS